MRHLHTLLRWIRAVGLALSPRRRRSIVAVTEPADLGTAFGLDAAIETGGPCPTR
ncbi:MAG TPA: hypothetical protein VLI72_09745 [Methylibium sp.]|nr:hypothetical protein [Methylibium sp.]